MTSPVDPSLTSGRIIADRDAFVAAMRDVPGAIAIVATSLNGERRGMAATAWCSLSADPPMVLACLNRGASAHPFILSSGAFALNLLLPSHVETVAIFSAQRGLEGDARFAFDGWSAGILGQPLLNEAFAVLECRLAATHDYGTHSVMIGEVAAIERHGRGPPLLYAQGGYAVAGLLPTTGNVGAPLS